MTAADTSHHDHVREHDHEHEHEHDHEHNHHHHDEPMTQEEAMRSLLLLGQVALNANDYESAVNAYASALKLEPNETAAYVLGTLYARGLGVRRNFLEAGRLFHQAELLGNDQAGKLCAKCMYDFLHEGIIAREPATLYAEMCVFASMVYPEATDQKQEVNNGLFAVASTLLRKGENAAAMKVFHAAADYGDDEAAQNYLAMLDDAGMSL